MSERTANLASQACTACREKKRKCSRELPVCSLCHRNRRRCDYPLGALSPTMNDSGTGAAAFPAMFFLDSYTFAQRRHVVPMSYGHCYVYDLGPKPSEQAHYYADQYFSSIHHFLPIVSKLRFYNQLNGSSVDLDPDLAVLSLVMKMHCQPREYGQPAVTEIYTLVKRTCLHAEQNNIISLRVLQALLLVATYEIGHGIYPAAYLTVGHCARLGYAMGIHSRIGGPQMFPKPVSWAEAEERRRVWWAVIILDRYVNLGGGNRPFASCDAKADDLLPMDEHSWDQGEPIVIQPLAVSAYPSTTASPFARACQASNLVSHVLRHVNEIDKDPELHYREAIQLHRTLSSFELAMNIELKEPIKPESIGGRLSAMAICYSAQMTLYDAHMCADADNFKGVGIPEQVEMQQIAIPALKQTCVAISSLANRISATIKHGSTSQPSPFTMDCMYQAALLITSYTRETYNNEYESLLGDIVNTMKLLQTYWAVANEYLAILSNENSST